MNELKPIGFPEANGHVSGKGCFNITTFKDDNVFISCWRFSLLQRIKVLFTGRIWLVLEHGKQPKEFKELFNGLDYHQPTNILVDKPSHYDFVNNLRK